MPTTTLVVEATSWQGALQGACALRGEAIALEQITVELIADGYRALNTETRAKYELRKAPEDAPLSQSSGAAEPGPFADEDTFAPTSAELVEAEEAAAAESPLPAGASEGAPPGDLVAAPPQAAAKAPEGQAAGGGAESKPKATEPPSKSTVGAIRAARLPPGEAKVSAISPKAVTVEVKAAGAAFKPKTGAARASEPPAKAGAEGGKPSDRAKPPSMAPSPSGPAKAGEAVGKAAGGSTKTPAGGIKAPASAAKVRAAQSDAVPAPPVPAARQPATTRAFGSEGAVGSDSKIRQGPPALPPPRQPAPLPPFNLAAEPAEWAESAPEEAPHILFARGEDPSAQSPLTYREVALSFSEGTSEADAERVLRQHLQALVEQLAASPPGKYVALAAFDVRFEGRPPKPPLVTLTWKDWHGAEPKVAYPAQQQALNASMAGMTIGSVFPSPFASLPGTIAAPAARGRQPPPLPGGPAEAVAYEVLFSRGEDPSARSPLTYREIALCFPEGTIEADAEHVLRQHLQAFVEQIAAAPAGKYVALAAFDVRFEGRPPKPPLVTLTWKDWHGAEPKVAYPAQQQMLQGSMAGMSMAGAFPSPFASLPGNTPSPFHGAPAQAPGGGSQILFARGEDPSAQSPLTYREVALCLPEGTAEPEAERVLRQHLQALVEQLAASPPGKYVALAAFDVRFEGRPPKPPLVTLTWKDWHGPEPKVAYPAQQRALHGSMAGMSMAGAFPSPFASLPGHTPSPFHAMPGAGHTAQMPRADQMNIGVRPPSNTPPPPAPARQSAGAARSPRDAKAGGGGGGNNSSEGWPPAAQPLQQPQQLQQPRPPHAASPDVFASPAVLAAQQQPALEPLPFSMHEHDADDKPTAVVEGLFLPPEARNEGLDAHQAVSTGEFAIVDEPTPLLGAHALSPEAFRDDAVPTVKHPPITPTSAASTQRASADRLQALEAGLLTSAPAVRSLTGAGAAAHLPVVAKAVGRLPAMGAPVRLPPAGPAPASDEGLVTTLKPLAAPRYPSSSDLLAQFFESIPALQVLESEGEGVAFLIELLAQTMPSRVIFCHVYDAARREFVLAGARAPSPSAGARLVGARTPELDPSLEAVLGRKGALVVREASADPRYQGGRWALAGEAVRSVAASAALLGGRRLGLLELANPSDGSPFEESEGKALEYVAEQFAEFLSRVGAGAGRA